MFVICGLAMRGSVQAQQADTTRLSLSQVLDRAVHNNPLVRIDSIDIDVAKSVYKEKLYNYEPALDVSFGKTDFKSSTKYQGGIGLTQNFPTGTSVQLEGTASPSSGTFTSTSDEKAFERTVELTFSQSLLQNGGLKVNLVPVRKATADLDIKGEELVGYAQHLLAQTEQAYWDLYLASRELEINKGSLELAQRLLSESKERLAVGKIAPLDLTIVKAEAASREKGYIDAQASYEKRKLQLLYLMNDTTLVQNKILSLSDLPIAPELGDSIAPHLRAALEYRPDLRQARILADKGELDITSTRNGLLPKLDAFISLSGTSYASSFSDAAGGGKETDYTVGGGLSLSWPITNGAARQRYRRAVLSKKQADISIENMSQLVRLDVKTAWIEANRAFKQINAARIASDLQEQKLTAEQQKLSAGKSTEYLVLQAQRDLTAAQLDEARATVAYMNAVTDLYLKDGTLLERRGIDSHVAGSL